MPRDETINLLEETTKHLAENGKTPSDVRWIGNAEGWFSWDVFAGVANVRYDNGFGGQEVCESLLVVGDDWWLERHEYDGGEWWEFKTLPSNPERERPPGSLLTWWRGIQWQDVPEGPDNSGW